MINRNYSLLLAALSVSTVGDWIFRLAIPFFIFEKTGSALAMSIAYAVAYVPVVLVMPFGGVIADRVDRKRLLLAGDLGAAFVAAVIAVFVSMAGTNIVPLYPLLLLLATIAAVYHPAFQSVVPSLVSDEQLPRANSFNFGAENLINVLGPLVGGALLIAIGSTVAVSLNVLSFVISFGLILPIRPKGGDGEPRSRQGEPVLDELRAGLRLAFSNPIIKYGTIIFVFANFSSHLIVGNFMYFLIDILGMGSRDVGLTIALTGVGGLLGAASAPALAKRFRGGSLMLACLALAGFAALGLLLVTGLKSVAAVRGLMMALEAVVVITMFTLRQRVVPSSYLGRTVGVTRAISFLSIPAAAVFGGWLLQATGRMDEIIWISGGVLLATAAFAWRSPFTKADEAPVEPGRVRARA